MKPVVGPLLASCLVASGLLCGAATVDHTCYRLASPPVMDGRLDEAAWQALPEVTGFFILGGKDYAVEKQTFLRAGWTEDCLFLAVKCVEPLPAKMNASTADGDSIWSDDAIEMFFAPQAPDRYFQMIANSVGARWNATGPDVKDTKPWAWEARPGKWEKGWLLEIRIPFSVLGKTPVDGDAWPVSIARDLTTGPVAERYMCWPPLQKGFSDIERFGQFTFKTAPPAAGAAAEEGNRLNAPFFAYLRAQCAQKAGAGDTPELREALDNPGLAEEATPLKAVAGQLAQLAGRADADPWEMAVLLATHRNLMVCLADKAGKLNIPLAHVPRTTLTFEIKSRDAKDVCLYVNGQPVKEQDGKFSASIREGLTAIGVTAVAAGANPGVSVRVVGHPETDGRWRAGAAPDDTWQRVEFDDRAWKVTAVATDGFMWAVDAAAPQVSFRQLVIWNEKHDGPMTCIQPRVREWGFSENSLETLFQTLYSPLSYPLEDYEFILDVPKDFKLLEEPVVDVKDKGGPLNRRPAKIATEDAGHEGQQFTRYRFAFDSACVTPDKTHCALIPLLLGKFSGAADGTCRFYFRRVANGNLTELEQSLPVRVLPPLNGRMPKQVLISQYCSVPWMVYIGGTHLFPAHFDAFMRQSLDVGFNSWFIMPWNGEYGKRVYDKVVERGGHVILNCNNYPIHGDNVKGALGAWMQSDPATQAQFFNTTSTWTQRGQYCPTYVTGEGAAKFKDAVKADIAMMMQGSPEHHMVGLPKPDIYWTDWEEEPWIAAGMGYEAARTGDKSYCFCPRCKAAFRESAKLPETTDLSDDAIFKNYKNDWSLFRNGLDGRIQGLVRQACSELGLPYMVYSGTNQTKFWEACKGNVDGAFPGCPGNGVADGRAQKSLDDTMTFFRDKLGLKRIMGQRFSFYGGGYANGKDGWKSWSALSPDGYINAKSWKPQTLRIVATFHGGLDYQSSMECAAGMQYYIGEATRIISEFEDLFWDGERADHLAKSAQISYPNLLVLTKGSERLVLLFNEGSAPLTVLLENTGLQPGQKGQVYGAAVPTDRPEKMEVTVAPEDVAVVHIK